MPIRILPVNKRLNFRMNSIYCKIFIYIRKNLFAQQTPDLWRSWSPLQLSSQTHFAKIEDKKSYCEKVSLKT